MHRTATNHWQKNLNSNSGKNLMTFLENKRKEESEKRGIQAGRVLLKGNCGGERDPTPWKVTNSKERSTEPEEFPDAKKSVAVSHSSEKQSEN